MLPKRLTDVAFADEGRSLIVSDAFGDIYHLPLNECVNVRDDDMHEKYLLLGHFATVTTIAKGKKYIASGDREGRIRVSRFPDAFVIQSFCLGHSEFVTSLTWTGVSERLLSSGGEGCVRLWDSTTGDEIACLNVGEIDVVRECVKEEVVITSIALHPQNEDAFLFVLHSCSAVFSATGLREGVLGNVVCLTKMDGGARISGLVVCEDGSLWISAEEEKSVRRYILRDGIANAVTDGDVEVVHVDSDSPDKRKGEPRSHADLMRFEWLAGQRKKEMVENWKGKKRRHVEIWK